MLGLALKKQRQEMLLHREQIVHSWLKSAVSILHFMCAVWIILCAL